MLRTCIPFLVLGIIHVSCQLGRKSKELNPPATQPAGAPVPLRRAAASRLCYQPASWPQGASCHAVALAPWREADLSGVSDSDFIGFCYKSTRPLPALFQKLEAAPEPPVCPAHLLDRTGLPTPVRPMPLPPTRLTRRAWLAAAALPTLAAQPPSDDTPIFSSNVRVVSLLATVSTKKGEIVRDLTKDDFHLFEDGRPQSIRYFSRETDLPLTLGLLIDTSTSQEKVLDKERGASFRFIDQVLRDTKDLFFILQFDMGVYLRQKLTASRKDLEDSLSLVDTPSRAELNLPSGAGTRLYDAVAVSCRDVMKDRHDRKAVIIMSDGVDTGSQATFEESLEIAQRGDTLVYAIYFSGAGAYFGDAPDGRHILERFARETGGGFFEVSRKHPIEQIFASIQDELRSQYSLGFVSDVPVTVHGFRKLELSVRTKGLRIQARDRYWAAR